MEDEELEIKQLNVAHSKLCITIRTAELYKSMPMQQEPVILQASLSEYHEIRELADGTPIKIGHDKQVFSKRSKVRGYVHEFEDVTFTFLTESSDISVVVSILDKDLRVLGETYVFPHGVIERDSYGPLINDIRMKGQVDFEVHYLKHPKVRDATDNPLHDPKLWHKPPSVHASLDTKGTIVFEIIYITPSLT